MCTQIQARTLTHSKQSCLKQRKKKTRSNYCCHWYKHGHVPLMHFPPIYIYPNQGIENTLIPTSTCIRTSAYRIHLSQPIQTQSRSRTFIEAPVQSPLGAFIWMNLYKLQIRSRPRAYQQGCAKCGGTSPLNRS